MTAFLTYITSVFVYAVALASACYLFVIMSDYRRWLIAIFVIAYTWLIGIESAVFFDLLTTEKGKAFGYWLTQCSGVVLIIGLAMDRVLFKRGFMIRTSNNNKQEQRGDYVNRRAGFSG